MIETLVHKAFEAKKNAYIPYSHFAVGAAVLCTDGKIYTGCNIENASYPAGLCAERTAIFKAVSEGSLKLSAIAVTASPCGICRQVMAEFADSDFKIYICKDEENYDEYTLDELLPLSFNSEALS